eukprot:g12901.t1
MGATKLNSAARKQQLEIFANIKRVLWFWSWTFSRPIALVSLSIKSYPDLRLFYIHNEKVRDSPEPFPTFLARALFRVPCQQRRRNLPRSGYHASNEGGTYHGTCLPNHSGFLPNHSGFLL